MLIAGCGDVGNRIAERLRAAGAPVSCLVRRQSSAQALHARGFSARAIDLDAPLPEPDPSRGELRIWYLAPPPSTGDTDPRMRHLLAALNPGVPHRIVYISTTGVYGDCGGDWVDERRALNPQVARARRRADAERQLRDWRVHGGGEVVILRVAGIYGPGKLPLERLRQRVPMIAAADAPWTNRIHIEDLVEVCLAAMDDGLDGEAYNVSDGNPGNMRDYFDRVADAFDLPRAPVVGLAEAKASLSPGMLSYLAESRRLDNRKMLTELQIRLRYPDLASGLTACREPKGNAE